VDRLGALYSAIDLVRRGGTVSLSGVYGGMADPMPMLQIFDKQIQLRMGQANVRRWSSQILPLLTDEDPLTTLVVEVTASLSEAGLPLHDADGAGAEIGGACLIPHPQLDGIVVTWRQHDRMSVDQVHGAGSDFVVQQVMNRALGDVLVARGFAVDGVPFGSGNVVRRAA